MAARDDYILDQLIELGYVTYAQVEELRPEADAAGIGVVDVLLQKKLVRSVDVTAAKAAHFGAEMVVLSELRLEDDVLSAIPRHIAKRSSASTVGG